MLTASGDTPIGVLLLEPSASMALYNVGGGVQVTGGVLAINSRNRTATVERGPGAITADEIDITGGLSRLASGRVNGSVVHGSPLADPLAAVPEPLPDSSTFSKVTDADNTVLTLSPGTYIGGIHLSGNANVSLLPGLYYLQGGGLSVTGNARLTGDGVTIYNAPKKNQDTITFAGHSIVALTAPTSGDYYDIVLFQKRTATAPIMVTGGAVSLTGGMYAPHGALSYTGAQSLNILGSSALGLSGQVVISRIYNGGHGRINVDATDHEFTDLAITVDDNTDSILPEFGTGHPYSVTVTNHGLNAVQGAHVTDLFTGDGDVSDSFYAYSSGGFRAIPVSLMVQSTTPSI